MNLTELSPNKIRFLNLLNEHGVEYLLVGGYAVRYYGYLRETRDLDIWTGTGPHNALKLVKVFHEFGIRDPALTPEPFRHENRIVAVTLPPISIEILNPIIGQRPEILQTFQSGEPDLIEVLTIQSGVVFKTCYAERVVDWIGDVEVNLISLAHLKILKQAGNRPKDLDDLAHLG